MKDYSKIANEYHAGYWQLTKDIPGPTKAFGGLGGAEMQNRVLSKKVKEPPVQTKLGFITHPFNQLNLSGDPQCRLLIFPYQNSQAKAS